MRLSRALAAEGRLQRDDGHRAPHGASRLEPGHDAGSQKDLCLPNAVPAVGEQRRRRRTRPVDGGGSLGGRRAGEPAKELQEGAAGQAVRVRRARDADRLEHARAAQLLGDECIVELCGDALRVRLDAADVVDVRRLDGAHQRAELLLEACANRRREERAALPAALLLRVGREQRGERRALGVAHQLAQLRQQRVRVFDDEEGGLISH
mmetsp:Transcript_45573/g.152012  ORF Transcript_45573/g.152012 Transcript_45573/m.152012 type:complete len:208 (-) Transcript_45573:1679-2302(-)